MNNTILNYNWLPVPIHFMLKHQTVAVIWERSSWSALYAHVTVWLSENEKFWIMDFFFTNLLLTISNFYFLLFLQCNKNELSCGREEKALEKEKAAFLEFIAKETNKPNTSGVAQIEGFLPQKRPQSFRGQRRKTSPMKVPKERGDFTWCSSIVIKQYCHSVPDTRAVGMGWWFNIELLLPCLKNFGCLVKWMADTDQSTVIHTQFYGLFFLTLWHQTQRTWHKGFCLLELTHVGFLT